MKWSKCFTRPAQFPVSQRSCHRLAQPEVGLRASVSFVVFLLTHFCVSSNAGSPMPVRNLQGPLSISGRTMALQVKPLRKGTSIAGTPGKAKQREQRVHAASQQSDGDISHSPSLLRPSESGAEAAERRQRESEQVEERLQYIDDVSQLQRLVQHSNDDLLTVVEVQSEDHCEVFDGTDRDGSKSRRMEPCIQLRSSLLRCVRDCQSTNFVSVLYDGSDQAQQCVDWLGVKHFPTIQFWQRGKCLWQHIGAQSGQQDLGEGLLFFGDEAKDMRASDFVEEVTSEQELEAFINGEEGDSRLALLDVSDSSSDACVHMFAAVFSMARSMSNELRCARLLVDKDASTAEAARSLGVTQVPTFFIWKNGGRKGVYVGSSRGELIGRVMQAFDALPNSPKRDAEADVAPQRAEV